MRCEIGMVVGPHPATADAGLEMLRLGGNAFDAAVAAAFTEGVVQPAHNGIAGYGGAAVGYLAAERRLVCVDYNTEAPAAAHAEMFPIEPTPRAYRVPGGGHKQGALSVGVPAIVAGLEEIHRSWGTLPLDRILGPAIRAARGGWACNTATFNHIRNHMPALSQSFPDTAALILESGEVTQPGDRMTNRPLAELLERWAGAGLRDFYEGETAARIVDAVRRAGGILAPDDLRAYRPRHVEPLSVEYCGARVHTPPLTSGGVTTLQTLRVLDGFDLTVNPPGTAGFYHLWIEVMKACWRRRLTRCGDPGFGAVPDAEQLTETTVRELRSEVEAGLRDPQPGERVAPDPIACTSHICAADTAGNVVSLTQTHGAPFGSWLSVPGTGLILAHGMSRFEPRPGWANSIAPRKRPLHNMSPILVTRHDRPWAAYGTPGGRTIVNNQAVFSACLLALGMDMASTLALPRVHCEEAEPAKLEAAAGEGVLAEVRSLGHQVDPVERSGGPAHGIVLGSSPGELEGATDPRLSGKVAAA